MPNLSLHFYMYLVFYDPTKVVEPHPSQDLGEGGKIPLISNAGMPPEKNKTNVPRKKEALSQTEANSTKAKKNDTNKNNPTAANKKAQKGKKQSTGKKAKVSTGKKVSQPKRSKGRAKK